MKEKLKAVAFRKTGIDSQYKLLKERYNCKILTKPKFNKDTGLWEFTYQDPLIGQGFGVAMPQFAFIGCKYYRRSVYEF